ncbi:Delta-aminolevulinic acid dehydratase [Geodia barretti]|uniref:Delta-aminolevulinic acid dehydratase n=3 Tax=Geodia barretti TaxID=519541 RepID=A0AA35S224_GEOBA|nr:Delta-aminolevulinic acid dehydratase [Geodia barretti]
MTSFPDMRLRRVRELEPVRSLIRETQLSASNFIYPLFVTHGEGVKQPIEPMPGNFQLSLDMLEEEISEVVDLGIPAVLLFGLPEEKDPVGSGAYDPEGIIQEAIRVIKQTAPNLMVVGDVCLCEYTDHGHCGVIENQRIDNDQTLELLARTALAQVQAGADMVAPSAMMDGQVRAIRETLDANGEETVPVMGYAAKYASAFYGPFRVAADSTPQFGDRRSYQMDPANRRMAMREIESDIAEGADIVMVKPALAYLDVIKTARDRFDHPMAAYNVSGEFSMVKGAARQGWIDEKMVTLELLTAIRRAGADIIISYHAKEVARWLRGDE